MKKFVVERNLPGAGNLSPEELQAISQNSCEVISHLGKPYHWIQSFITGDKIYCIHIAESEAGNSRTRQARQVPNKHSIRSQRHYRSTYRQFLIRKKI